MWAGTESVKHLRLLCSPTVTNELSLARKDVACPCKPNKMMTKINKSCRLLSHKFDLCQVHGLFSGFPCTIEKVLNCDIGFQDLEEVLKFASMYMKY